MYKTHFLSNDPAKIAELKKIFKYAQSAQEF